MKVTEILKSEKGIRFVTITGIGIMILVFLFSLFGDKKTEKAEVGQDTNLYAYEERLEQRLTEILENIEGTGEVKVMITLERSGEDIYSEKGKNITTTVAPTVRGVVVYCSGSSDILVREKVTIAVSRALGIGVNKVCVTY